MARGWPWRETWNAEVDLAGTRAIVRNESANRVLPRSKDCHYRYHRYKVSLLLQFRPRDVCVSIIIFFWLWPGHPRSDKLRRTMSWPSSHAPPRVPFNLELTFLLSQGPSTHILLPSSPHASRPHQSSMHRCPDIAWYCHRCLVPPTPSRLILILSPNAVHPGEPPNAILYPHVVKSPLTDTHSSPSPSQL